MTAEPELPLEPPVKLPTPARAGEQATSMRR